MKKQYLKNAVRQLVTEGKTHAKMDWRIKLIICDMIEEGLIEEGGNVSVNTISGTRINAQKTDMSKISKGDFTEIYLDAFRELNNLFEKKYNKPLWTNFGQLESGYAFNGSAEALFSDNISHEEFAELKPFVGDIDVTIPHEYLKPLWHLLKEIQGTKLTPYVEYAGNNKATENTGEQINALLPLSFNGYTTNVQVDFEGVGYTEGKPDEFSKFGHSSSFDDMKQNIKGVAHKFLMMTLVSLMSREDNAVLVTPSSTPEKCKVAPTKGVDKLVNKHAFSIDKGLRIKVIPFIGESGDQIFINDKPAFKELPTVDSDYERGLNSIFEFMFGTTPTDQDMKSFWSFVGLLNILDQYADNDKIEKIFSALLQKLWGPGAQGLEVERGDGSGKERDFAVKDSIAQKYIEKFPFVKKYLDDLQPRINEFYTNYRVTSADDDFE